MDFINRKQELAFLEDAWEDPRASLIILHGRRRVGKTELLKVFGGTRRHVFFVATQATAEVQLRSFGDAVRRGVGDAAAGVSFSDWESALLFLAAQARHERMLVVLDEFPYVVAADGTLPSVLQKAWDETLRRSRLMLVLCGSSVSFMEAELLAHKSPLYGRRTGQFRVEPMDYRQAGLFFPNASGQEKVELYATLGGMPAYLLQFRPRERFWENVRRQILRKGAFLHDEVNFLLMQELREPRLYLAVLTAIAEGRTRLGDIAQRALGSGPSNRAGFYLQTLQDLRLVERLIPVTETAPHQSRKGIYRIADPFIRFWLRFVFQESSALEMGSLEQVVEERVRPAWSDFVAPVFEDVCRQFVRHPTRSFKLPLVPAAVGSWWSAAGEIDIVALDSRRTKLLCGECKWSTRRVGTDVLDDLRHRSRILAEEVGARETHLMLFARRGFTDALQARARHEGVQLLSSAELYEE